MNQINLSSSQKEIVSINDGAFLVVASAGSGKTRVLTERIKRLLSESNSNILTITFTNKAAEEIKERLIVSKSQSQRIFIGTFHNLCQSILELRFKLLGYAAMPHIFEDDSDRIELIEQVITSIPFFYEKYKAMEVKARTEYKYSILAFISEVKREVLTIEDESISSYDQEKFLLFEAYQDILLSNNAIDFDDLILLTYKLFVNNESVVALYRKNYNIICIDEAQDLNKAQYLMIRALAGNSIRNIMMVGDPNQSIFAFNGSSSDYMMKHFVSDFDATIYKLSENYRCSKSVIDASNRLLNLQNNSQEFVINGIFKVQGFEDEYKEANQVIKMIKKLIELGRHPDIESDITYDSITVLARNRYVFRQLESKLVESDIPYYYRSAHSGLKFASKLMQIFDHFFRIKINPSDKLHLSRLQRLLKVNDIYDPAQLSNSSQPLSEKVMEFVKRIRIDNLSTEIKLFRQIFLDEISNEISDDERKLIIDDIDELNLHWVAYQVRNERRTLAGFKSALALGTTISQKKQSGVSLSTVHTMKGQESDVVFLIGMDEGTFPDFRAVAKGGLELQQEQNNAYVAFTRARRFLFVYYPKTRQMPWGDVRFKKPSRFLKNLI